MCPMVSMQTFLERCRKWRGSEERLGSYEEQTVSERGKEWGVGGGGRSASTVRPGNRVTDKIIDARIVSPESLTDSRICKYKLLNSPPFCSHSHRYTGDG